MKKIIGVILLAFIASSVLILTACNTLARRTHNFFSMDTVVQLTAVGKDNNLCDEINARIEEICLEVENQISKTVESSDIYRLNHSLTTDISVGTAELLNTAKYIKEITDGAYEPALGDIIDLWGINNGSGTLPHKTDFYAALAVDREYFVELGKDGETAGTAAVKFDEKLSFDLGGIGKGYAIDQINQYLKSKRTTGVLASFVSSVLAAGKNKGNEMWSIGIKNPLNPEIICGAIGATDKIISISGGYERYVEIDGIKYCHIIDPVTGYPVDNDLLCVIVVMDSRGENNGVISDALSTALYVMGKQNALDFYIRGVIDFEMILFVKADTDKGYDVISTNVIFEEIE